jgi:prepilin-type N-terminal cleavage/methylation domain-containing protein
MWNLNQRRGFSLIELLIVVAIILIIITIALPKLSRARMYSQEQQWQPYLLFRPDPGHPRKLRTRTGHLEQQRTALALSGGPSAQDVFQAGFKLRETWQTLHEMPPPSSNRCSRVRRGILALGLLMLVRLLTPPRLGRQHDSQQTGAIITAIRTLHTAQVEFYSQYGRYAASLTELGPPPSGAASGSLLRATGARR